MKIDCALILAAGAGSRMGKIGQRLPKVIWPVFEKRTLELEVLYARKLGAKKIFINLHHYKEQILRFISSSPVFENVEILIEKDKIDIGGAIHNLANQTEADGNLLVLNSDQFIFMNSDQWSSAWEKYKTGDNLLFAYQVNSNQLYNELKVKDDRLLSVVPNQNLPRDQRILTYTGMSLINLKKLKPAPGPSKFFETVANPQKTKTLCYDIRSAPYWDFGTLERYWLSSFKLLQTIENGNFDLFGRFLMDVGALDSQKIKNGGYAAKEERVINLSGVKQGVVRNKIILKGRCPEHLGDDPEIVYEDLSEKV
ncbi:MAG: sugar phosphate nucleotidyltransferase [Bacteriovoracaceae bacterium]